MHSTSEVWEEAHAATREKGGVREAESEEVTTRHKAQAGSRAKGRLAPLTRALAGSKAVVIRASRAGTQTSRAGTATAVGCMTILIRTFHHGTRGAVNRSLTSPATLPVPVHGLTC